MRNKRFADKQIAESSHRHARTRLQMPSDAKRYCKIPSPIRPQPAKTARRPLRKGRAARARQKAEADFPAQAKPLNNNNKKKVYQAGLPWRCGLSGAVGQPPTPRCDGSIFFSVIMGTRAPPEIHPICRVDKTKKQAKTCVTGSSTQRRPGGEEKREKKGESETNKCPPFMSYGFTPPPPPP